MDTVKDTRLHGTLRGEARAALALAVPRRGDQGDVARRRILVDAPFGDGAAAEADVVLSTLPNATDFARSIGAIDKDLKARALHQPRVRLRSSHLEC